MGYNVFFGQWVRYGSEWDHFNISHDCQNFKKLSEFEILKILKFETLHFTRDV